MKITHKISGIILTGALTATTATAADLSAVPSGSYSVDPTHAYIQFQYNHLGLSNPRLGFEDFSIEMELDNADTTKSTVNVEIRTDSIITGSEIFHEHMTGEKWFDASNNPNIGFSSSAITANSDGTYQLTGDLTVKGVTKPVTLDVVINNAMMHPMAKKPVVGISATGSLNRSDWDLGANVPYISDAVTLEIQAEMLKSE